MFWKRHKKLLFRVLIIFVTGLLLFLFFWRLTKYSISDFYTVLLSSKISLLAIALLLAIVSLIVKAYRYFILVKPFTPTLHFIHFIPPFLIGYGFSVIGPFKTGEIVSIEINKQTVSVPRAISIAALAVFRIFDLLLLVLVFALSFIVTIPKMVKGEYMMALVITFLITFIGLIILCIALFYPPIGRLIVRVIGTIMGLFVPKKREVLREKLSDLLEHYYNSLRITAQKNLVFYAFLLTLLRWLIEFFIFWLISYSFSIKLFFFDAAAVMTISLFVGLLSMTPGGLGSGTLTLQTLLEALGAETLNAAASVIFLTITSQGLIAFSAFVASIFTKARIRKVGEEKQQ